jgi:hypothetical protein
VTPQFKEKFKAGYRPSYSNENNYKYSVLEYILEKNGTATSENWQHDSIFDFAPDVKIDWKRIDPKTKNASISHKAIDYDCTHYGFIEIYGDPYEVGSVLEFKLVELVDKKHVWKNKRVNFDKFFLYRPIEETT